MMDRSDFGWHDERRCPDWCASADQHERERREGIGFRHEGAAVVFQTAETVPNDDSWLVVETRLVQTVQVDERGHNTRPATVMVDGETFTPENARRLATSLTALADQADAVNGGLSA